MSREEFNIDKVFRDVAHKHQEAYDPNDWNAFQTQLQANGLQAKPSMMSQIVKYLTKLVITASMVYMLPASNPIPMEKNQGKATAPGPQVAQVKTIEGIPAQVSEAKTSTSKQQGSKNILHKQSPEQAKGQEKQSNLSSLMPEGKSKGIKTQPIAQDVHQADASKKKLSTGVIPSRGFRKSKQTNPVKARTQGNTSKPNPLQAKPKADKNFGNNTGKSTRNKQVAKTNPSVTKPLLPKVVKSDKNLATRTHTKQPGNSTKNKQVVKNNLSVAKPPLPKVVKSDKSLATRTHTKQPGNLSKNNHLKGTRLATAQPTPRVNHAVPTILVHTDWAAIDQDTTATEHYMATHADSIQVQTHQDAIKHFWEGVAWSQRPRNVFEKAARWLRIVPDPQRIAQKELKRKQAKDSLQTLAKASKIKKDSVSTKQTPKRSKKNRFLGINMPKVKLGKFLHRFFKAKVKDTSTVAKKVDTTAVTKSKYTIKELHVGFVYPLSSNGTGAYNFSNRLSIHALLGGAAALDGTEFSGFGNIERDYVKGAQFAGFFNTVGNSVNGFQAAGFFNNAGSVKGVQLAGFLNMSGVVKSKEYRFNPKNEAVQAAGFGNLNFTDNLRFQAAGFFNIGSQIDGFQGAGFFNVTRKVTGFQGSGFMGIAQQVKGAQISGFMNLAEKAEGLQMAGFLNVANEVKGYQIGFINIADSISNGIPIGFLSIVRNGYRRWEAWTSESLYANVGYKIGVKEFYNIFAVGGQFLPQNTRWGLGYGIGTIRDLNANRQLSIEAMAYHINENKFWDERFRLFSQVKFLIGSKKRNSWHFGPTLNLLTSQDVPERGIFASEMPPYQLINSTTNGRNTKFWIGFQAGIRF
ncbi:hypothetical protein BKI52_23400 [marine bacterium AO1-C]|nr:hypothetical protein BKI52_23400 [marine bacterium AO1-C]